MSCQQNVYKFIKKVYIDVIIEFKKGSVYMSSNFANNIKHLRNEHKLTKEQFGKIFGVTRQCVANINFQFFQ